MRMKDNTTAIAKFIAIIWTIIFLLGMSGLPVEAATPSTKEITGPSIELKEKEERVIEFTDSDPLSSSDIQAEGTRLIEDTWGSVSWNFDPTTGALTIGGGAELGGYKSSPWNRTDNFKVDPLAIKKISFTESIKFSADSSYLFSSDTASGYLTNLTTFENLDMVDASDVRSLQGMFAYTGLPSFEDDFSAWDLSLLEDASHMFEGMKNITELSFTLGDHIDVTDFTSMFASMDKLEILDISTVNGKPELTNMTDMFKGSNQLKQLFLGPEFEFNKTNNTGLVEVPTNSKYTGNWQNVGTGSITEPAGDIVYSTPELIEKYTGDMTDIFVWQPTPVDPNQLYWGTSPYSWDEATKTLTIGAGTLGGSNEAPWMGYVPKDSIETIVLESNIKAPKDSSQLFSFLLNLKTFIGIEDLDVSDVETMRHMFSMLQSLESLDLNKWQFGKTRNMDSMFFACLALIDLKIDKWDTSKVEIMDSMFRGGVPTENLDISAWDMTSVTSMDYMLNNWNMQKVPEVNTWSLPELKSAVGVFSGLVYIEEIDISNWNTPKLEDTSLMFQQWSGENILKRIDISSLDMRAVTNSTDMFNDADMLTELTLGPNVKLNGTEGLKDPVVDGETVKWRNIGASPVGAKPGQFVLTAAELMEQYDGATMADTYMPDGLYWGTSPYTLDETTKTLTIEAGELSGYKDSPWNRTDGNEIAAGLIEKIIIKPGVIAPVDSSYLFSNDDVMDESKFLSNLTAYEGIENLDVSKVEKMEWMFACNYMLTDLDLSTWRTPKLNSMIQIFNDNEALATVNLSGWDTSRVTDMNGLFSLPKLKRLDLSGWQTGAVETMYGMFNGTKLIEEVVGLEALNTSSVKTTTAMFFGTGFKDLNLSKWETPLLTETNLMFFGATKLETLNMEKFDMTNVTNPAQMFSATKKLRELTLGSKFKFAGTEGLKNPTVDEKELVWRNVDKANGGTSEAPKGTKFLTAAQLMETYDGETMADTYVVGEPLLWGTSPWVFDGTLGTLTIEAGTLSAAEESPWNRNDEHRIDAGLIKKIIFEQDIIAPANSKHLFSGVSVGGEVAPQMKSIEEYVNIENLDVSNVTNMESMFTGNASLEKLDLSTWQTSNVTNMRDMFAQNTKLIELNINAWDTGKVEDMSAMFWGVDSIETLDLSNWNTENVRTMELMFALTNKLTEVTGINNWKTPRLESLKTFFFESEGIKNLDLSKWETPALTNTRKMIFGASNLESLNLKNFDMTKITEMGFMFSSTRSLGELTLGPKFKFVSDDEYHRGELANPVVNEKVRSWQNVDEQNGGTIAEPVGTNILSGPGLMDAYNSSMADTYVPNRILWGTAPWSFDEVTGTLTIEAGVLGTNDDQPWDRRVAAETVKGSLIKKIVFEPGVIAPADCKELFASYRSESSDLINLTSFEGLESIDVSNVETMQAMFPELHKVTELNLSGWNTAKLVNNYRMFWRSKSLEKINLSGWDTSQLTTMKDLFRLPTLKSVDTTGWQTGAVKDMTSMFHGATLLEEVVGIENWDVTELATTNNMFNRAGLQHLDLSEWNTPNLVRSSSMFVGMTKLETLNLAKMDMSNVTSSSTMFDKTEKLRELTIGPKFKFDGTEGLGNPTVDEKELVWRNMDKANGGTSEAPKGTKFLTAAQLMETYDGETMADTYVPGKAQLLWGTSPYTWDESTKILTIEAGELSSRFDQPWNRRDTSETIPPELIEKIVFKPGVVLPANSDSLFSASAATTDEGFANLTSYEGLENIDASKAETMNTLFANNHKVTELDLSSWKTPKLVSMKFTFSKSTSLETINLSGWDMSGMTSISRMFSRLTSLKKVDATGWQTGAVTDMTNMFYGATLLEEVVGIENWDVTGVTTTASMFYNTSLQHLDLSKWDTPQLVTSNNMFSTMTKLETVNIEKMDMTNVTSSTTMFEKTEKLRELTLGPKVKFLGTEDLKNPIVAGKELSWKNVDKANGGTTLDPKGAIVLSGLKLMETYDGATMADTYVPGEPLLWGTSPWHFNNPTKTLTIEAGVLDGFSASPWNRGDSNEIESTIIEKIVISPGVVAPVDSSYLFSSISASNTAERGVKYLENVTSYEGIENLDVSNTTNFRNFFLGNSSLRSLDLNSWNTAKVTNMFAMFQYCEKLESLEVNEWDTSSLKNMSNLFLEVKSLVSIDLSKWNTGNLEKAGAAFYDTDSLSEIAGINNWSTAKLKSAHSMFTGAKSLRELDLSNWNTPVLSDSAWMFSEMDSLEKLNLANFDTRNVTARGMEDMFEPGSNPNVYLNELTLGSNFVIPEQASISLGNPVKEGKTGRWRNSELPLSENNIYTAQELVESYDGSTMSGTYVFEGNKYWGTSPWDFDETTGKVTIGAGRLKDSKRYSPWATLAEGGWELPTAEIKTVEFVDGVVFPENSANIFDGLTALESFVNLNQVDTSEVTSMAEMFKDVVTSKVTEIVIPAWDVRQVTNMREMFKGPHNGLSSPKKIDVSTWKLESIENLSRMFQWQQGATEINVSGWNLESSKAKSITMLEMFQYTDSLLTLDVGEWKTNQVVNMASMFSASGVGTLDVANWDLSSVTTTSDMFFSAKNLEVIDVKAWNTAKVTRMDGMFGATPALKSLDFTNWDTKLVTNMSAMFMATGLRSVDLSLFDTRNVTDMSIMFRGSAFDELDLSSFKTDKLEGMLYMTFAEMPNLKKLTGLAWDVSRVAIFTETFSDTPLLEELDLSTWKIMNFDELPGGFPEGSNTSAMFNGMTNLKKLHLGKEFDFISKEFSGLPKVIGEAYTGNWQTVGEGNDAHPTGKQIETSDNLMKTYDGETMSGVYVWRPKKAQDIKIKYVDQENNPLADLPDKTLAGGVIETDYDVTGADFKPALKGYEVDENQLPKNATGKFSHGDIVVKYVYKKTNDDLKTKGPYRNNLSLTWVPREFELGKRWWTPAVQDFKLESVSKDRQWVVVNEDRADTDPYYGQQWAVSAKMGELKAEDDSVIEGAKLMFTLGDVKHYELGDIPNANGDDVIPQDPNDDLVISDFTPPLTDISLGGTGAATETAVALEGLVGGSGGHEVVILEQQKRTGDARKREGFATKLSDQRLFVPKVKDEALFKDFSTEITWTLTRDIR